MSDYTKVRVLSLHWKGVKVSKIAECLVVEDGIQVSKQGAWMFLKHFYDWGAITRKPSSG